MARHASAHRTHDRHRDWRSRREPQRARRRHARAVHLRGDHARAVHRADTVLGDSRSARAWRRPLRGRHANGARVGGPPAGRGNGRTQPRSDVDWSVERSQPRCLFGISIREEPLRVERAAGAARRSIQVHFSHASRALRPGARSRGTQEHHRRARFPCRAHGAGAPASRRGSCRTAQRPVSGRSRNARAACRARLHRIVRQYRPESRRGAARSEGQDRRLQSDDVGTGVERRG